MLRDRIMMGATISSLPLGYTKIEYIETDGASYIDTFYNANQNTRVVMKVSGFPNTSNAPLFGARTSYGSSDMFGFVASGSSVYRTSFYNENINIAASISYSGEMVVDQNKNITYLNGSAVAIATSGTFSCPYTLHLFSFNDGGAPSGYCKVKFYYCQIYDNGVKVRDYVPCSNPIGVKGLWDKVNEEFYALTPTGYTRLAYLESDGSDYIDTLYKPNSNTRVIFEGYNNNANSKWLFGTWNASGSGQFGISMQTGAGVRYGKQTAAITSQNVGEVYAELNKTAYNFNGTTGTLNAETFTCSYNLFIGALNNVGTPTDSSYGFIGRIYSVKIYDNGVLVRDFIPCTNPDGISGLWDSVNDVFYKLLPADYTRLDFIETDGTTYIDAGFKPNQDSRIVMDVQAVSVSDAAGLFGARTSASSNSMWAFWSTDSVWKADYASSSNRKAFSGIADTDRLSVDYNKNVCTINGVTQSWTAATFQAPVNMTLFCLNTNGTYGFPIQARLYSCQIYDNGTLVRDFIPAMNASGEAGLYDLKNDVWYALLPIVKPKVENKISIAEVDWGWEERTNQTTGETIWVRRCEGEVTSTYPVATEITGQYRLEGEKYSTAYFTLPEGISVKLVSYIRPEYTNGLGPDIISVSPTEDDTYIYTF